MNSLKNNFVFKMLYYSTSKTLKANEQAKFEHVKV